MQWGALPNAIASYLQFIPKSFTFSKRSETPRVNQSLNKNTSVSVAGARALPPSLQLLI